MAQDAAQELEAAVAQEPGTAAAQHELDTAGQVQSVAAPLEQVADLKPGAGDSSVALGS